MANWIKGAISKPGAFREEAKRAGKGTMEYAREKASAGGRTGKRARLALTLRALSRRRSSSR
jgi:hypothetical protein